MNKLALALLAASLPLFGADEALPSVETVYSHFIAATGGKLPMKPGTDWWSTPLSILQSRV